MNESPRQCSGCSHWDPKPDEAECGFFKGTCRRFPPVVLAGGGTAQAWSTEWPRTLDRDWCGEWQSHGEPPLEPDLDSAEERQLRNVATAQALLALPSDTRDQLLQEVLTEEELGCSSPPEDFYERVQRYFAVRRQGT